MYTTEDLNHKLLDEIAVRRLLYTRKPYKEAAIQYTNRNPFQKGSYIEGASDYVNINVPDNVNNIFMLNTIYL